MSLLNQILLIFAISLIVSPMVLWSVKRLLIK